MIESLTLLDTETNKSVTIDKDNSDFVLNEASLGSVPGTHHSYKYVSQVGVYIDSTTLEERTISISGWVIGATYDLLRRNKELLNRVVNPQHLIQLSVFDGYKLEFKPDYSIQYSSSYRENNEVLCTFLIQGTCANPMFTTVDKETTLIAYTIPKLKFPLVIPQGTGIMLGLREPSLIATIQNNGDIDTGMLITFRAKGSVTNPNLLNVNTREYLKINRTMEPGETITISTESGKKYVQGTISGNTVNYFRYLDLDSVWMQLHIGENILKYDADEGASSLDVSISYYPKFLEVQ